MNADKKTKECRCTLCQKCQFYLKETDACQVKGVEKCSEKEVSSCADFLIKDKLVHF